MRPLFILVAFLLGLTWIAGCGTVGSDFSVERAQSIENGKTTKEDIAQMFGEPFKTGIQNGHPVWVYEKSKWALIGDEPSKSLIVEFDDKGVVRSHQVTSNEPAL